MNPELQQAIYAFQNHDHSKAKTLVERYLKTTSNDADAYMLLAAINASNSCYNEVIIACEKVLDISPNHPRALYNAAVACQMIADYQGVILYTDKLIGVDAKNIQALTMRVIALHNMGNKNESLEQAYIIAGFGSAALSFIHSIIEYYRANHSLDLALDFINKSISFFPNDPELYISKVNILLDLGNVSSVELLLASLESKNIPAPYVALARSYICSRAGNSKEAIAILEPILHSHISPLVRSELGKLYTQVADYEKAENLYNDNIQKQINIAESYHALGNIYDLCDDYNNAISAYTTALKYSPTSEPTYYNLALLNEKKGDYKKAIECIRLSPKISTGQLLKQMYVRILSKGGLSVAGGVSDAEFISIIEDNNLDPQPLSNVLVHKLRKNEYINSLINASISGDLDLLISTAENEILTNISESPLFLSMLSHISITNYEFECFIRMLRRYLLLRYKDSASIELNYLDLYTAISIQSFLTGYVLFQSELEQYLVKSLSATFEDGVVDNSNSLQLIALSMYMPVNQLINSIDSDAFSGIDSKYVTRLLKIQYFDRIQEEDFYSKIESPFDIADETSVLVRNQYEDSPYPVWESLSRTTPRNIIDIINEVSPYRDNSAFNFKDPDILIAGCGTGSHVMLSSMRIRSRSITAIDLSKRSLAFAMRKAFDYGLDKVRFIHMDILKLPDMKIKYDVIESIGVIHHMRDPALGLACLAECLKQGGLLNLAVYSATARRYVLKARSMFNREGQHINDDEIRSVRIKIMCSNDPPMVENISGLSDFYALHECRDLIFHECERDYTIPELSRLITEAGLAFIGFDFNDNSVAPAYRKMFPGDDMTNLENWNIFENKYPDTFIGMYNVWCYKL